MKVRRILTVSIKREPVVIPPPAPAPTFNPIGAGSELSSQLTPMAFDSARGEMRRWRIEAAMYSNRMPVPANATHIAWEVGRSEQEAWSAFVYAHAKMFNTIKIPGVVTFICLGARVMRPSREPYPAGIPQFPSLFIMVRETAEEEDFSFAALPQSKTTFRLLRPQTKS